MLYQFSKFFNDFISEQKFDELNQDIIKLNNDLEEQTNSNNAYLELNNNNIQQSHNHKES
jgi:hypothetical protein